MENVKRIGIIGGGPGGLMLGLLLQQQGHNVSIFEKADPNVNRDRGGSLDIHDDSGQLALKEANIYEQFKQLARYEGEDTKVVAKDGTVLFEEDAEGEGSRPEIDRGVLCDIIMNQLEPSSIQYGYTFNALTQLENDQVEVSFKEGNKETFDLVIGADGAFSKVRSYISDVDVEYNDISMVELNVNNVKNNYPDLAQFNKNGKMMALGDNKAILGQLNGDGRIKVYMSYLMDADKLDDYKALSKGEIKQQLLKDFADWSPELKKYIEYASDDMLLRRIYKLPIGFTWESNGNITLMGDAAHLMSPFAGEGVNMALYDAYLLASAIKTSQDLKSAIAQYEEEMYAVSKESAQGSQDNLEVMFSDTAAEQMAAFFNSVIE
ncbi:MULTISPECIES: FAD-dependent oxidoreductase [Staphylococcus]|uniref:FAD-dependent oxidoreductase n=1 Tax=Staphylococcus TaxID=1279 RepID=UPI000AEBEE02|nr:NAD(P)/FAD-dependent oxidoreductase [Staphylococcus pasteuri]MCO0861200.1 FAD-dependent monooxygenase [Staphylococcus pasteuri]MCO5360306.1 FAD-dependent monooxygenase [Staphylococcus pasteuri]QDW83740.1 FAD-dependent monooxygenase [Staphylococcus pasteuri]